GDSLLDERNSVETGCLGVNKIHPPCVWWLISSLSSLRGFGTGFTLPSTKEVIKNIKFVKMELKN
ncbi:MAG: hypothetical protein AAF573_01385, partial [Bacteroidota bacterium]